MATEIQKFSTDELTSEIIDDLVSKKASFQVVAAKKWGKTIELIEERIEKAGLRCRVYTEYSSTAATAGVPLVLFGTPIVAIPALVTAAAVGVHRLATFNPDYEIAKNRIARTITVRCEKGNKDKASKEKVA